MSAHYPKLRAYFLDVTRELIGRGIIKAQTGQPLPDVLAAELVTVLRYVQEDMTMLIGELGISIINLGGNWLSQIIGKVLGPPPPRR